MEFLTPTYHLRKDEMTTLCKECLQNGYRTYGGTDDEHHHTMPNPTPQQLIEELVREFTDSIIENYPPRHRNSLSRDMLTYDLQHIATQAYMAGLDDVERVCPVVEDVKMYNDWLWVKIPATFDSEVFCILPERAISQLKEQINQ